MIDVSSSKPLLALAGICTWTAALISIHQVHLVASVVLRRERNHFQAKESETETLALETKCIDGLSGHSKKKLFLLRPLRPRPQTKLSLSPSVQIVQHLRHYTEPLFQRYIVRIVFMVPFYAVASFFGLLFPVAAPYLDTVRDCYEVNKSFFVHSFSSSFFLLPLKKNSPPLLLFPLFLFFRPGSSTTSSLSAWPTSEGPGGSR